MVRKFCINPYKKNREFYKNFDFKVRTSQNIEE